MRNQSFFIVGDLIYKLLLTWRPLETKIFLSNVILEVEWFRIPLYCREGRKKNFSLRFLPCKQSSVSSSWWKFFYSVKTAVSSILSVLRQSADRLNFSNILSFCKKATFIKLQFVQISYEDKFVLNCFVSYFQHEFCWAIQIKIITLWKALLHYSRPRKQ